MFGDDEEYSGKVSQVGKAAGKDKNRCWIRFSDGSEKSYDFMTEIEKWGHQTTDITFTENHNSQKERNTGEVEKSTCLDNENISDDLLTDQSAHNVLYVRNNHTERAGEDCYYLYDHNVTDNAINTMCSYQSLLSM